MHIPYNIQTHNVNNLQSYVSFAMALTRAWVDSTQCRTLLPGQAARWLLVWQRTGFNKVMLSNLNLPYNVVYLGAPTRRATAAAATVRS